jgi:hypothetical protein
MIKELDTVILTANIPEHNLEKGDIGTVVFVHTNNKGYEVEFGTLEGETLAVISLDNSSVRLAHPKEILHVREVA